MGLDDLGQGEGRHLSTSVFTAVGFLTGLPALRGIDAVEPDLAIANVDGVAVDDARLACEIGVGKGRERKEE